MLSCSPIMHLHNSFYIHQCVWRESNKRTVLLWICRDTCMNHRGIITFNAVNVFPRVLGMLRIYKADYILNTAIILVWRPYPILDLFSKDTILSPLSILSFFISLFFYIWSFTMEFKVTFCVLYFLKYSLLLNNWICLNLINRYSEHSM